MVDLINKVAKLVQNCVWNWQKPGTNEALCEKNWARKFADGSVDREGALNSALKSPPITQIANHDAFRITARDGTGPTNIFTQ